MTSTLKRPFGLFGRRKGRSAPAVIESTALSAQDENESLRALYRHAVHSQGHALRSGLSALKRRREECYAELDRLNHQETILQKGKSYLQSLGDISDIDLATQRQLIAQMPHVQSVEFNRTGIVVITDNFISRSGDESWDWGSYHLVLRFGIDQIWVQDEGLRVLSLRDNYFDHPHLENAPEPHMGGTIWKQGYKSLLAQHRYDEAIGLVLRELFQPWEAPPIFNRFGSQL